MAGLFVTALPCNVSVWTLSINVSPVEEGCYVTAFCRSNWENLYLSLSNKDRGLDSIVLLLQLYLSACFSEIIDNKEKSQL